MASQNNIEKYIEFLDNKIVKTDHSIKTATNRLARLKQNKEAILKAMEIYPDLKIEKSALCSNMVWDKVQCMTIDAGGKWRNTNITVRFSVGFKHNVEDAKIFAEPLDQAVAHVNYRANIYGGNAFKNTITILDYKRIIPDICPNKSIFERRIKKAIIKLIQKEKLTISSTSFDIDTFEKLMLLT